MALLRARQGARQPEARRRPEGRRRASSASAIEEPLRWIATNAGQEGSIVVQQVKDDEGRGRLQRRDRQVRGPGRRPASSTRRRSSARRCRTPSSIASLLLTTEALVSRDSRREEGSRRAAAATAAAAWAGCTDSPRIAIHDRESQIQQSRAWIANRTAGREQSRPAFFCFSLQSARLAILDRDSGSASRSATVRDERFRLAAYDEPLGAMR